MVASAGSQERTGPARAAGSPRGRGGSGDWRSASCSSLSHSAWPCVPPSPTSASRWTRCSPKGIAWRCGDDERHAPRRLHGRRPHRHPTGVCWSSCARAPQPAGGSSRQRCARRRRRRAYVDRHCWLPGHARASAWSNRPTRGHAVVPGCGCWSLTDRRSLTFSPKASRQVLTYRPSLDSSWPSTGKPARRWTGDHQAPTDGYGAADPTGCTSEPARRPPNASPVGLSAPAAQVLFGFGDLAGPARTEARGLRRPPSLPKRGSG